MMLDKVAQWTPFLARWPADHAVKLPRRRVEAPNAEELEISTGILRLLRGRTRTLCVLTGHGEPALDDTSPEGLSEAASFFRHNAYRLELLDLTVGSGIAPHCREDAGVDQRPIEIEDDPPARHAQGLPAGR